MNIKSDVGTVQAKTFKVEKSSSFIMTSQGGFSFDYSTFSFLMSSTNIPLRRESNPMRLTAMWWMLMLSIV